MSKRGKKIMKPSRIPPSIHSHHHPFLSSIHPFLLPYSKVILKNEIDFLPFNFNILKSFSPLPGFFRNHPISILKLSVLIPIHWKVYKLLDLNSHTPSDAEVTFSNFQKKKDRKTEV